MKIAKISVITALVAGSLLACATLATAQDAKESKKGRGPSVQQRLDQMSEQLNLTDAQKPKVKAVLEENAKKMQELRGDTSLSQEQRREKMQAMREEQTKKFKEILTPEQYEKYQKMPRGGRQGGGEKKKESSKKD